MWISQPCPMARWMDDKLYCILEGDFDEVLRIRFQNIKILTEKRLEELKNPLCCLNAVIVSKKSQIKCPTKQKTIRIKGKKILKDVYESVLAALTFLDPEQSMCSECLYKAFATMDEEEKKEIMTDTQFAKL